MKGLIRFSTLLTKIAYYATRLLSAHYLILECIFTIATWHNSKWQINLEAFQHLTCQEWFELLLDQTTTFPCLKKIKKKCYSLRWLHWNTFVYVEIKYCMVKPCRTSMNWGRKSLDAPNDTTRRHNKGRR